MKIRKILLLIGISTIMTAGGVFKLQQGSKIQKPDEIPQDDFSYTTAYAEHQIRQVMKQQHLPSFAVVLIDDQEVIWQEAFGTANLESNEAAEIDTVYRLWSVSKAMTAIETMRLVEDGLVDLDAPITEYLPDFSIKHRFSDSDPITLRSILTHRAGLPRNGCYKTDLNPHILADLAASLADCYQVYPVGYRYKYSNIGFDLLGYLIENLRDRPFPDQMRDELLGPIGMVNSAFIRSQLPAHLKVAPGYEYYKGEYYPYNQGDITSVPSGNMYGTIEDMGKLVQFIFREDMGEVLDPETLKTMFTVQPATPRDPVTMGLGWKTNRVWGAEQLVWHDGGPADGTGALVAFLPERKLGLALIANATSFESSVSIPLALEILERMLEAKTGVIPPPHIEPAPVKLETSTLSQYTGKYIVFGEVMEVYLRGDQLKGRIWGLSLNLDPLNENTFQPRHWLASTGLTTLLGMPVRLDQLKITFMPGDEISTDFMLIDLGGISYEYCPEYPDLEQLPPVWKDLIGEYERVFRLPSGAPGEEVLGRSTIEVDSGVLRMSPIGTLLPISETEIIVLDRPFDGETILYQPETGRLYHQSFVYQK